MSQSTIFPIHDHSSKAHSSDRVTAPGDDEIQALLEQEREKLIQVTNFLDALYARLTLNATGTPRVSIVGKAS
ncbi:hypothetical protein ACQZ46_24455 [Agrobacterium salinitolerans]